MFELMKKVFFKKDVKNVPFEKKIRILVTIIDKILTDCQSISIPKFQRVQSVISYIISNRLVNYYFTNRSKLPHLCERLNCIWFKHTPKIGYSGE